MLGGELTVGLGPSGEPASASAGMLVRVPPLVVHGFRNDADAELRCLNFHAPGRRFAEFMRALRDGRTFEYDQEPPPPADGGRPVTEAVIGELALMLGDRELRAPPGSWVQLPAGVPHAVLAPAPAPVRVVNVHTPSFGFGAEDQRPAAMPRARSGDPG